jgi:hypothetical protein
VIGIVPMGVSIEIDGLAGVQQRLEARIREQAGQDTEIAIVAGGARGASRNALIARSLAEHGRNMFYASAKTLQLVKAAASGLFAAGGAARRTADSIGNMLLIGIHENLGAQKNPDGAGFRPLTTGYARRKQRKWGFTKPIGRASGDLLGGLLVRVTRSGDR